MNNRAKLNLTDSKAKFDGFHKLPFEARVTLKAETKVVAAQLRAAGFEISSSGYGGICIRLDPADAGDTLVPVDEARKLLA